jgi:RNA polymerase sigma-70 factor (ECF subfamily)
VERGSEAVPALTTEQRFAELYAATHRPLVGYCYRLVGDTQTAADVAQEAFTRLFARVISVREPRAWLFLVATNLCRDVWRDQERQRSIVERTGRATATDLAAHDMGVRDLVERLPSRLRDVVVLHYYADLPVAHVAAALHKPVGTVKRRLLEARALLSDDLRTTP